MWRTITYLCILVHQDPAKPNSYDEFVKERARYHRKREEERRQKEGGLTCDGRSVEQYV